LKPPENASIGEKVLWEVFGSKQQKTKPQVVTETGEKMARQMETEAMEVARRP